MRTQPLSRRALPNVRAGLLTLLLETRRHWKDEDEEGRRHGIGSDYAGVLSRFRIGNSRAGDGNGIFRSCKASLRVYESLDRKIVSMMPVF